MVSAGSLLKKIAHEYNIAVLVSFHLKLLLLLTRFLIYLIENELSTCFVSTSSNM